MSDIALSVVIPAYNEAGSLLDHLAQLQPLLQSVCLDSWEVIVVDDGSSDRTAEVVTGYAHPSVHLRSLATNQGKGAALREGMKATSGERVLMCDADMSTAPELLIQFMAAMDAGADIVIGNRRGADSQIVRKQPLLRRSLGKCYICFSTFLLGVTVRDVNCGFKLFRGDIARELFASTQTERWAIDIEILALAARKGYRVDEVPVVWRDADKTSVSLLRDVLATFFQVLRLFFRLR